MRWEIKTSTKTEGDKKYTTKWKVQYITIGDIVMMGKSAAGAVVKLAQKLPEYIENYKNMRLQGIRDFIESENLANMVNSVVQPLSSIIQGMEIFKKIMNIVDSLTPIVKTVARATGVWCSPGNALDMAQIILSTVKQILIGIAVSAVMALKDWIWNFEFEIRRINLGTTVSIIEKLKKSFEEDQKNKNILQSGGSLDDVMNGTGDFFSTPEGKAAREKFLKEKENSDNFIKDAFKGRENTSVNLNSLFDNMFGEGVSINDKCKQSESSYITDYLVEGTTFYRMLSGSSEGKGIFYSDDNGKNWFPTEQNTLSFAKFAKINKDGKTIYVAGGTYYIKKLSRISDEEKEFSKDEEGKYNKDYFNRDRDNNINKLSKNDKNELMENYGDFLTIKNLRMAMDMGENEKPKGIFYSDDDGITWKPSNILDGSFELFFEFPEKEGYPQRIVASSYDYKGIYYTDDGKEWKRCKENDKEINNGRWVQFTPSMGIDPVIKNANLEVDCIINKPHNNRIIRITSGEIKLTTKVNGALIGEGLDVTPDMDQKIREIIKEIHKIHPITSDDKVVTEDIWRKIILEVEHGKYSMIDAVNGKYLEEYI